MKNAKTIFSIVVIIGLFLAVSYWTRQNMMFINNIIAHYYLLGIAVFLLLSIFDVVFLPILIPFIPVATNTFGFVLTAIIVIAGWSAGIIIVFYITRLFGKKIVAKLLSFKEVKKAKEMFPQKSPFLFILLLRIFLPLDIGSYYLSIIESVNFKTYLMASLSGLIPVALFLSYVGELSITQEAVAVTVGLAALIILSAFTVSHNRKKQA